MIEVNTTYPRQTRSGVDTKVLFTSVPVTLSRTQSEFGLAWANKMSTSKQTNPARFRLTFRWPVVSHSRHESATFFLTNSYPSPASGAFHRALISGQRTTNSTFMPTWAISTPVPAFFISRNTPKPFTSGYSEHNGCSCFSLGCQ